MAENSKIEWTKHTFNPWIGCEKVSEGCANCYAESLMSTRFKKVKWGKKGIRKKTSPKNWENLEKWNEAAEKSGRIDPVFVASLADIFEDKPDQPEMDEWRQEFFDLVEKTPNLFYLLLTKRPENIMAKLPENWLFDGAPRNVGFGVSAENQKQLDIRWPLLDLATHLINPELLFLSYEPALGFLDLDAYEWANRPIGWLVAGGESGTKARPADPDWFRSVRQQCLEWGIPFLFKQWGAWLPDGQFESYTLPAGTQKKVKHTEDKKYWKVGKKAAGNLLDGQAWLQFPDCFTPPD